MESEVQDVRAEAVETGNESMESHVAEVLREAKRCSLCGEPLQVPLDGFDADPRCLVCNPLGAEDAGKGIWDNGAVEAEKAVAPRRLPGRPRSVRKVKYPVFGREFIEKMLPPFQEKLAEFKAERESIAERLTELNRAEQSVKDVMAPLEAEMEYWEAQNV